MRPIFRAALVVALFASLAGCKENGLIQKVIDGAIAKCKFAPAVGTVGGIIDAVSGGTSLGAGTIVATAVNGICAAVKPTSTAKTLADIPHKPTFAGVEIEGSFVD
jgi:hypothetical protein